jgi:hypothetical protein
MRRFKKEQENIKKKNTKGKEKRGKIISKNILSVSSFWQKAIRSYLCWPQY